MSITQLYDLFILEQQYRNNTDVTIAWYKVQLTEFFTWLESAETSGLTLYNFKSYGVYLRGVLKRDGCKLSSSSVQCSMRAVKAFYNFCIENNYLEDFSRQLRLPKVYKKEQLILDDDEIRSLMDCFSSSRLSLRNKCFVALMLDCGLRRGEIPRLNVGDVNLKTRTLLINGKGTKQRVAPMGELTLNLLRNYKRKYLSDAADSTPFFLDRSGKRCTNNLMKQVFQELKTVSGIERLHPHLLRHTFATYYLADGGDLETLRLILGHSNIQTTQMYLHLAFNLKLSRSRFHSHLDKLTDESAL